VDPVQQTAQSDRKTLTAPRFDCEFYETGNLARQCNATGGAKGVIDPVLPGAGRSTRTLTAQKILAIFARNSQDVERLEAQGDARFNEKDANGTANSAVYTAGDQIVRLRGGEPTFWDSRERTKAAEIESDRASEVSYCRGRVQTSYYSQEQTNGATPFSQTKGPVYIVAERAEFHESAGVAVYSGGARSWQGDNFVSADSITLYREEKRMEGHGHVQSGLYQAKTKTQAEGVVPVFASADSIVYAEPNRLLHYEGNVDIRQGADRITSGVADVYLMKEKNEVDRTIAERRVVITQPGRRGTGDWVQYTAADEVAVLKGNPAHVEDVEQGSMESGRLTLHVRENRVVADDASGRRTGRVRTVHKVRKQ
jgi:lipopolysaccharide export system protein LptA